MDQKKKGLWGKQKISWLHVEYRKLKSEELVES